MNPPNYGYWARMATWSLSQSACILAEIEPRELDRGSHSLSSIGHFNRYQSIYDQLSNQLEAGAFGIDAQEDKLKPTEVLKVARILDYSLPPAFEEMVCRYASHLEKPIHLVEEIERLQNQIIDLEKQLSIKPKPGLSTTQANSLLIMVYAMAHDHYGYDPKVRSTSASEISEAAAKCGLSIDEDTARKWLKEAAAVAEEKKK